MKPSTTEHQLPGESLNVATMPAHWLLARIGKRILRPGGRKLTQTLLVALQITPEDRVVELAPGLGMTTRLILNQAPGRYTGVERDQHAAEIVRALLTRKQDSCRSGTAQQTGLPDECATVVLGEAFLSMQPDPAKTKIVAEAFRVLRPGGRYGLHELAVLPDGLPVEQHEKIRNDLSAALLVGARPLARQQWHRLLEDAGFDVSEETTKPMALLRLQRLIEDEGPVQTLKIIGRVLRDPATRRRVRQVRAVFRRHEKELCAIALVATKPA